MQVPKINLWSLRVFLTYSQSSLGFSSPILSLKNRCSEWVNIAKTNSTPVLREALKKIGGKKIDLILLDIAMPEMDGIETFRRMKEDYLIETPVIFLTASGDEDDVLNAISLGAVNYLKKPFRPQELLKRVAMGLERK